MAQTPRGRVWYVKCNVAGRYSIICLMRIVDEVSIFAGRGETPLHFTKPPAARASAPAAQYHGAEKRVFELADIARPAERGQDMQGFGGDEADPLALFGGETG